MPTRVVTLASLGVSPNPRILQPRCIEIGFIVTSLCPSFVEIPVGSDALGAGSRNSVGRRRPQATFGRRDRQMRACKKMRACKIPVPYNAAAARRVKYRRPIRRSGPGTGSGIIDWAYGFGVAFTRWERHVQMMNFVLESGAKKLDITEIKKSFSLLRRVLIAFLKWRRRLNI